MKNHLLHLLAITSAVFFSTPAARADNPFILDQFTADPTARAFGDKIYLYPSHDILAPRGTWFRMADYHVFSTENLMDWTDHGVIVSQDKVAWVNPNSFSMWAPDCVSKNGKYYFFFPAQSRIGVAIADKPEGPYKPEPQAIAGANGIDPCCLIDPKDGKAYLVWASNSILVVGKLKDNMTEFDGQPVRLPRMTQESGLIEGPFLFERKGIYYMTFPHASRQGGREAERLEYAISRSPLGPYTYAGIIMDQSPSGCWTNHHSLVEYQGQWMLFYHNNLLNPDNDRNRSSHADYLTFNDDGTINKVIPTLRGVGVCDAKRKIQIDRHSAVSKTGTAVSFLDNAKRGDGWKIALTEKDAFAQYDRVEFGEASFKTVKVRANSATGATIELHLGSPDSPVIAKIEIPKDAEWKEITAKLTSNLFGLRNLVVTLPEKNTVEIDWLTFE